MTPSVPRIGGDPGLLASAIAASGLSARRFAVDVLDVDERTVRYWLADERGMPGPVRVICRAIVADPAVAAILSAAAATG